MSSVSLPAVPATPEALRRAYGPRACGRPAILSGIAGSPIAAEQARRRELAAGERWNPQERIAPDALDPDAIKVLRRLRERGGFKAYLVGGCVRDLLVGQLPKDFDIATDARPRQVKRLFGNSRIIGRRFRLVHVTFYGGRKVFDVSTFRSRAGGTQDPNDPMIRQDNQYGSAEEDAERRDFRINGLYFDPWCHEVIDYVGGLEDLERGIVQTIGDPWLRFREDPVRMLRAVKFAGRLGFRIEDHTYQAIIDCRRDLSKAAVPRVQDEIVRLMNRGAAWRSITLALKSGMIDVILPEVARALAGSLREGEPLALPGVLRGLDELTREGREHEVALLLACLLAPLVLEGLLDGSWSDDEAFDDLLRPITLRLRLSRRDGCGIKRIFADQRRLMGQVKLRKRSLPRLLLGPSSDASLLFLELHAHALGREDLIAMARDWRAQQHALAGG